MGDAPRTVIVKRGLRHNWRESLDSILEDGELSKFTVHPSGTLHLHITRPTKDTHGSNRNVIRKNKKLCALSSWVHSARNMLNLGNSRVALRDQCVQTDCTIPVFFDRDETEEICSCRLGPSAPKPRKGYFTYSNRTQGKDVRQPSFDLHRDLAVPKTKPRWLSKIPPPIEKSDVHKQSAIQTRPRKLSSDMSGVGTSYTPLKDRQSLTSSPYDGEEPSKRLSKENSPRRSTGSSGASQEGSIPKNTLTPQLTKTKRSDNPDRPENTLKPTIGLARVTSHIPPHYSQPSSGEFHNKQETSRSGSWESHVQNRSHRDKPCHNLKKPPSDAIENSQLISGLHRHSDRPNQPTNRAHSIQEIFRRSLWKGCSSYSYISSKSNRKLIVKDCNDNKRLRRKNGSYTLRIPTSLRKSANCYDGTGIPQYYHPPKLTRWSSPRDSNCAHSDHEYKLCQQISARYSQDSSTCVQNSKTDITCHAPIRLKKVYSYYEMISQPLLNQAIPRINLDPAKETTATPTELYHAGVARQLSNIKPGDDLHSFLLQIKNVLSSYFNKNCKSKSNRDIKYQELGK